MSNFLANVARRGAGIAARHQDEPTAAVRPVLAPVWRAELTPGPAHDPIEEQAWSRVDQGVDIQRPADDVVAQLSPQLPISSTLIDPPQEKKAAPVSNPAVPAETRVRSIASEPVIVNMYSPAAESSDHAVNAGLANPIAHRGADREKLQTVARPVVKAAPVAARDNVPSSRQSSSSLAAEKPAEAKLQPRTMVAPDGVDLAPRSDAGQRREAKAAANPVAQEQRIAPAPVINVLPQPRRDAPQSGSADHARAEQSQIVVKIGKVEVRASQGQRPVRASRPRGSSGFAEMALRRAHVDRNYR